MLAIERVARVVERWSRIWLWGFGACGCLQGRGGQFSPGSWHEMLRC